MISSLNFALDFDLPNQIFQQALFDVGTACHPFELMEDNSYIT